jgi:hypothetical protein
MKWETVGDSLYIFCTLLSSEDVLIREISPGFYQIRPLAVGAHVTVEDNERFYAFVWDGEKWVA